MVKVLCSTALMIFLPVNYLWADQILVPMDPWPPWKLVDTQTWDVDQNGLDNRLIKALLDAYNKAYDTNLMPVYRGYPWKRCLEMMRNGQADLISGILKRPERQEYMIFIEPPYKTKSSKVIYVPKGKKGLIRKYEDLYNLKIGVQAGVRYFEPFDSDPKIQKEEAGDDLSNLRKLAYGRINAVISTETQADYLISVQGLGGRLEKAEYRYDYDLPVYFAISKKSNYAQYASRFSKIAENLAEKKVFENIIRDYFHELNQSNLLR